MSLSALSTAIKEAQAVGAIDAEGTVATFSALSQALARGLGRTTCFEYAYPAPEREMKTSPSTSEFLETGAKAGTTELYDEVTNITHFTGILKTDQGGETLESLDPTRPQAKNHQIIEIRPSQELSLP